MSAIRTDHCAGPRAAACCFGAGIAMLVSTVGVYAQHSHATQHPHITQHPNVSCPHGLGHLPGHHAHHCRQGSMHFPYDSPSYDDYQHLMRDFDPRPPADLRDLPSRIRQIQRIEETVIRETQRIIAYQRELQQRIWAQTSWGTRGAGGNLSGPNAKLHTPDSSLDDLPWSDGRPVKVTSGRSQGRSEGAGGIHNNTSRPKVIINPFCKEGAKRPQMIINPFCKEETTVGQPRR